MKPITTIYGDVFPPHSELYHELEKKHFVDKINYRAPRPLDEVIREREVLKCRMISHPDKNHAPTAHNQIIKIA